MRIFLFGSVIVVPGIGDFYSGDSGFLSRKLGIFLKFGDF